MAGRQGGAVAGNGRQNRGKGKRALRAEARDRAAPARRTRRAGNRSGLRLLGRIGLVAGIWGVAAALVLGAWFAHDLPDVRGLYTIDRRPSVTMVAADGAVLATYGELYAEPVRLAEMPRALPQALIATEDRRFRWHFGLDPLGFARAMYVNLRAGRLVQGGSTITQQLAKNVFLTPERTLKRKVQELMLAFWLEAEFSKEQILELYLNRVYFGSGAYGVEAAAQRYFDKSARQLALPESAMLIGLLKAPSRFSPAADLKTAQARAGQVLANMADAGFLPVAEAQAATARPAQLARSRQPSRNVRYFADWVLDDINDYIGRRRDDLVVVTTLDARLQAAAERAVEGGLEKNGERLGVAQAALVAMTPDGAVRAMVGGRDYRESVFNRAAQARRQPGSAFKLFIYLAGLEAGIGPDALFDDAPISIGRWEPKNYEGSYAGQVSVRQAVARSINTVAVQVAERAGRRRVIEAAERLGITAELKPHPSLALGVTEVTLVELAGAYAAVAGGGIGALPHGIVEIRTRGGEVIYRRAGSGAGRVIGTGVAAELNDLLGGVISGGTGRAARLDRPAAGKTGTSSDFRDAWFFGYTAELVAGVWVGNDDGAPMKGVTGGGLPAQIWRGFMLDALKGSEPRPLVARAPDPVQHSLWQKIIRQFSGDSVAPAATRPAPPDSDPTRRSPGMAIPDS
jgi:penicillin-binding protein 1A